MCILIRVILVVLLSLVCVFSNGILDVELLHTFIVANCFPSTPSEKMSKLQTSTVMNHSDNVLRLTLFERQRDVRHMSPR